MLSDVHLSTSADIARRVAELRKMGKEWATKPQSAYLRSNLAAYRAARTEERQELFFSMVESGWHDRWSEREAVFDEATPDSPPLTKDQLDELGIAVEKRSLVSSSSFTLHNCPTDLGL